jgi:hypothetical protein
VVLENLAAQGFAMRSLPKQHNRPFSLCLAAAIILGTLDPAGDAIAEPIRFETHIRPLLESRCVKCHGQDERNGGLDLRRRFTMLQGGDNGPAIVVGDPDASLLVRRIERGEMPPKEEEPLEARQKQLIRNWIADGAPLERSTEPPLEAPTTTSGAPKTYRNFWAFQPPKRPPMPHPEARHRIRAPIDALLLHRMASKGVEFNPDASKAVLLRRLCFDLLGLPPTLEQIDDFLADERPDAYERLVDKLLACPQYGERWGRHWLDVAGYADSDGYLNADRLRPEAWRYRDYVIQAHNADLPYDQFVTEQLAADELSDWRRAEELTPEMARQLTATGFLRTAADPTYVGYAEPNEIHQVISDTMQILGSSLMGLTIQCARCHDHKYDPISQRDYYALQAVLLPALDPTRWLPSEVRAIPLASEREIARVNEHNRKVENRITELTSSLAELTTRYQKKRLADVFARVTNHARDTFDNGLDPGWVVNFANSATGWTWSCRNGRLEVSAIAGGNGDSIVRLVRPVLLTGGFELSLSFGWGLQAGKSGAAEAMTYGLIINLRDAAGRLVVGSGYLGEQITGEGAAIMAIHKPGASSDYDLANHRDKRRERAEAPAARRQQLPTAGSAVVTIRRDTNGIITAKFDAGKNAHEEFGENQSPITSVDIEFRRHSQGATAAFAGLFLDEFLLAADTSTTLEPAQVDQLVAAMTRPENQRTADDRALLEQFGSGLIVSKADLEVRYPDYKAEADKLSATVEAERALLKSRPFVLLRGLMDLEGPPPQARIQIRGELSRPGPVVEPDVPKVLVSPGFQFHPVPGYKTSSRRLALARWLTDPKHPLTARVHVNRIWAHHFGRGLVPTVANFGMSGAKPTHPELLDWLATEFVRSGWSQKELHRVIVTSTAYRQTSDVNPSAEAVDPNNELLWAWRPRRIEGEVLRDSLLAANGKLNTQMYGPPVPVGRRNDGSIDTPDDAQGNRRSVYLIVRRSMPLTILDVFDTPPMETNCPQRSESTVPLQALALLHSPFAEREAAALGDWVVRSANDDAKRTQLVFRRLYGRDPSTSESRAVCDFVAALQREPGLVNLVTAEPPAIQRAAWQQAALVLINANEFVYVH